ncbi:MAG: entericidin EcnA/B family protein [Pseudomonadota bacterium]
MKTLALAVLVLNTLAGCATIEGLGRDISAGSRAVADAL